MKNNRNPLNNLKIIIVAVIILSMTSLLCGCFADGQQPCNHNHYLSDYQDASTSKNGFQEFTCSNCGNSYREVIPFMKNVADDELSAEEKPDNTRKKSVKLFDLPAYSDKDVLDYVAGGLSYESEVTDVSK